MWASLRALLKKFISIILKPSVIFSLLIYLIGIIGLGISSDTVSFDGSDDDTETKNDSKSDKDKNSETENKDISSSRTPDYSNSSKWYVEKMKFMYEQLAEHESKWLEDEKEEYERTKVLPENSLHSIIAESREQDAKEMLAINEALNKFSLDENPNDIGSSDNKRSIVEDDQLSSANEENKKSKIVVDSETNMDNITNKNVNSNN
jgi:hypothetical protein